MKLSYYLLFSLLLLANACSKSPNGGIPSYIKIENVALTTSAGQGSNLHAITDLWIESEGEYIGNFEYPNVIPALISGQKEVIMNAGIYRNGDYYNREIYPAYQPYQAVFDFTTGDTTVINPTFQYYNSVVFPLIEDFESGNVFAGLDRTLIGDANNLDGKALHIHLDASLTSVQSFTSSSVIIEQGNRVYIEMQFKGSNDFALGIQGIKNGSISEQGFIDVFYSEEWYKIHYDITDVINQIRADSYNFYIEALKTNEQTSSDVYLDNFKVVVI
jgi:hypothetical protein